MILILIAGLVGLLVLFSVYRFVIEPKRRMKHYEQYKGVDFFPFIPLLGAFKMTQEAYEKFGDESYYGKRWFETKP